MEKKNKNNNANKSKKEQFKKGKAGNVAKKQNNNNNKTVNSNKPAPKKVAPKKVEEKKEAPKKVEPKKVETKKVEPKKVEEKKEAPKKIEKLEVSPKEEKLEKTIIFDGKDRDNLRSVVDKLEEQNVVTKNKIVRRKPFNKYIIYVLTALIFITLIATTTYVVRDAVKNKRDKETLNSNIFDKVKKNYKDSSIEVVENTKEEQYDHFKTLTLTEFEKKILDKENMTILISSQTCLGCLIFEPDLENALAEADKKIYRLDITEWSDSDKNRLRTYYHFSRTPSLFVVKNGIVTKDSSNVDEDDKDGLIKWAIDNL